jgi:putative tryptophan/tyrosine transport system substrate-binding protein
MMRRRAFITLLGGAAAWPLAARAQQSRMPVIGLLSGFAGAGTAPEVAFRQGLQESGFVEGQNVAIEYRRADGQYDRLAALAANLIGLRVAVIATLGEAAAHAAKAARSAAAGTIPIVFSLGDNPIALGLVDSFNHPGGNITGATSIGHSLGPKRAALLHEFVPNATVIALLTNPNQPREFEQRDVEEKVLAFGWQVKHLTASSVDEFDSVFATLSRERISALMIAGDTFLFSQSGMLASLALRHAIPTIGPFRAFAAAGGLSSYGPNIFDVVRQAGIYTGRILKGEKPADLPVMQPTKFEFVINLNTAKALALEIPPNVLALADEVIE